MYLFQLKGKRGFFSDLEQSTCYRYKEFQNLQTTAFQ